MPTDPNNRVFVDPRYFGINDIPIICLVDDLRGFISWAIKSHTSGNYNHACIIHAPGLVASQDWGGFKKKPIDVYMTPGQFLKFWRIKDLTQIDKINIASNLVNRLALPWYKRQYDWLGIFGQFVHLDFIQNPWALYCSEQVRKDYIAPIARAAELVPTEPSPADLDRLFKENPDVFECLGYYFDD